MSVCSVLGCADFHRLLTDRAPTSPGSVVFIADNAVIAQNTMPCDRHCSERPPQANS